MGAFMAIQGLWAVPWMMEVDCAVARRSRRDLLVMRRRHPRGLLVPGLFASALAQPWHPGDLTCSRRASRSTRWRSRVIAFDVSSAALWWWLYGLGAAANVLAFTVLNEGFPRELAGRTNTALNLMMFAGSFAMQWGVGIVVEFASAWLARTPRRGPALRFRPDGRPDVAALAWLFHGWKRFSIPSTPLRAAS